MNILFLTPRFPYPLIGGDRIKPYNLLKYLSKSHNVHLVTFYQGGTPPKTYIKEINELGINLNVIPLYPIDAGLRTVKSLFNLLPLEVAYYTQTSYKKVVNELLKTKKFDLAFAFFMRTSEYIKEVNIKKILIAEDCRTLYQYRSYKESRNILQKSVRFWEYNKLKKYEPIITSYFDITTCVTDVDLEALRKLNPNAQYRLLTNGVDINKFVPPKDNSQRRYIIFTGKLNTWANVLMIQTIVNEIFPIIKKQIPEIELKIVGSHPLHQITNICKSDDKIELISDVPEIVPYLQSAKLFLHPHSGGSGIQNKLLEAMACGCSVVTTPTGIQGIDAKHGEDVLIGNNPKELAKLCIEILSNQELANKLSKNAREVIVNTHSWQIVFKELDDIINELFS